MVAFRIRPSATAAPIDVALTPEVITGDLPDDFWQVGLVFACRYGGAFDAFVIRDVHEPTIIVAASLSQRRRTTMRRTDLAEVRPTGYRQNRPVYVFRIGNPRRRFRKPVIGAWYQLPSGVVVQAYGPNERQKAWRVYQPPHADRQGVDYSGTATGIPIIPKLIPRLGVTGSDADGRPVCRY